MVRIRKNANNLTDKERERFLEAFGELNARGSGRFRDFRDMHTNASVLEAHFAAGFLPWHRAYLLDLERELQEIDPSVTLPYWRFDKPAPNLFKPEFMGVPNEIGTVEFAPSNPLWSWETDNEPLITRIPEFDTDSSPATPNPPDDPLSDEAATMGLGTLYADFWEMNPHGSAHLSFEPPSYIEEINTAARDPLFFLLHCNVDRLWAKWQWFNWRFNPEDPATYEPLGSAGDPGTIRVGHNSEDDMWPWKGPGTGLPDDPRPGTAPGGPLAASPTATAPGDKPKVRDMIDYQGVIDPGNRLGFGYDDVRFTFRRPRG
jgi:tyrosinase